MFIDCQHCGQRVYARIAVGPKKRRFCGDTCRKAAKRAEQKARNLSGGPSVA